MKVRKKPVVVEAVRWTGDNIEEVLALVPRKPDGSWDLPDDGAYVGGAAIGHVPSQGTLEIPTLEGTMTAQLGDWIVRGTRNELYPCKPDAFEDTFEEVTDA